MALGKNLNIGGMDNSSPKTTQSQNRQRLARNILHARDNRIIPRYPTTEDATQISDAKKIEYITNYDDDILVVANTPITSPFLPTVTHIPQLYVNGQLVPNHSPTSSFGVSGVSTGLNYDFPLKIQSYRLGNVVYFINPVTGSFCKYDGVEVSAMGSPTPVVGSQQGTIGTNPKWVKVINHCIDFQGNEVVSEAVKFPIPSAQTSTSIWNSQYIYTGIVSVLYPVGDKEGNTVQVYQDSDPLVLTEENFYSQSPYYASYTPSLASNEITLTASASSETNITQSHQIGTYVIHRVSSVAASTYGLVDENNNAITGNIYGIATKIKSISPLKLDADNAKYLTVNKEWKYCKITLVTSTFAYGSRNIHSMWASNSEFGVYTYRFQQLAFPYATKAYFNTIDTNNVTVAFSDPSAGALNISPILGDWYDEDSIKLSPNAVTQWGLNPIYNNYGMTTYQDLLVSWSDDLIWFSDTSSPPSYEQFNVLNFIKIGDTSYGKVITCCGTQNFLFVSRELKNYMVTGNIASGNYSVQELVGAEVGAWAPNASINIKDSVVFLSSNGLYQVANGTVVNLAEIIPKNFNQFDNYTTSEDVIFKLTTDNVISDLTKDEGVVLSYDEFRDLLVMVRTGSTYEGSPTLVFNTRLAEFYEWNNLAGNLDFNTSAVHFYKSKMYIGTYRMLNGEIQADSKLYLEDKTKFQDYASESPIEIYSTWLHMGEPSLEKQLLQLKIFGYIYKDQDSSITIKHYKDWDAGAPITSVTYYPDSDTQYNHKQRLNSDKFLSVSIGMTIDQANVSFELESFELEFNSIQAGVKK